MAFADATVPQSRVAAVTTVILVHLLLGYMLVTGLAPQIIMQVTENLKTFDVQEPAPPPKEEAPPPPQAAPEPTKIAVPKSIIPAIRPPSPLSTTDRISSIAQAARLRSGSFNNDTDYPSDAYRREEQGTVRITYTIGVDGRVASCGVVASSGSSSLDATTCRILQKRFRFSPAQDAAGNPVAETRSQAVTWRLT